MRHEGVIGNYELQRRANIGPQTPLLPETNFAPLKAGIGRIKVQVRVLGTMVHTEHYISKLPLDCDYADWSPHTPFGKFGVASDDGPMPSAGRTRILACCKGYKKGGSFSRLEVEHLTIT
jgi:hypothetical protein